MSYVQLAPTAWCVARRYHDGLATLGVFGPVPDEQAAQSLVSALQELGVGDLLEVLPIYGVAASEQALLTSIAIGGAP